MAIAGYNIYLNSTKVNTGLVTGLTYTLTGLTASTSYNVEVRAVDDAGNESLSDATQIKSFTTTAAIIDINYTTSGTVIADAGGSHSLYPERVPASAFDGDPATFYDANSESGSWVGRDLGTAETLNYVSLLSRPDNGGAYAPRMNGAEFQYSSDKINWTTLITVSGITTSNYTIPQEYTFADTTARYWRLYYPNLQTWNGCAEMVLWYKAAGTTYTIATRPDPTAQAEDTIITVTDMPQGTQQKVAHAHWVTVKRKVIFDTDWWTDCDDVVATRILVHLEKLGYIDILGVVISTSATNGISSLHAFLTFEGRGDVPLGIPKTSHIAAGTPNYQQRMVDTMPYTATMANTGDAVSLYREKLANSTDKVDIVVVGFLNNVQELLESPADAISGLTGAQLVAEKVNTLYVMGGKFPSGTEHNFNNSPQSRSAAQAIASNWPGTIIFHGFEIGHPVISGTMMSTKAVGDPVTLSMSDNGFPNGRRSWDPMTVLMAGVGNLSFNGVDLTASGYSVVRGTVNVAADGSNTFTESGTGTHYYIVKQHADSEYVARLDSFLVPGNQTTKIPLTPAPTPVVIPTTSTNYSNTGIIIDDGTGPWSNEASRVSAKAFDGYTTSFYDPAGATNTWVGRDFISAKYLNQVRIFPRPDRATRLNNAKIQYSQDAVTWTDIVAVGGWTVDTDNTWREFSFADTSARYWRLFDPELVNVGELEFHYKVPV